MPVEATRQRFLSIAKQEFLEHGFLAASLRGIAKKAELTLGAFYRYYPTKGALFDALVEEPANEVMALFKNAQVEFTRIPAERQFDELSGFVGDGYERMISLMCDHAEAFKLVFCKSEGTSWARYLDELVAIEDEGTANFMRSYCALHPGFQAIDPRLTHILSTTLFEGIVQVFDHDMPKSDAMTFACRLREFYTAGWQKLLGFSNA